MSKQEQVDFAKLTPPALKKKVDEAIRSSRKHELHHIRIRGVRRSEKDKVIVTTNSPKEAATLYNLTDEWAPRAFTGASHANHICQLIVH
jgi:hypothetical protein